METYEIGAIICLLSLLIAGGLALFFSWLNRDWQFKDPCPECGNTKRIVYFTRCLISKYRMLVKCQNCKTTLYHDFGFSAWEKKRLKEKIEKLGHIVID